VEYEVVFSGRGFTDGHGLSSWTTAYALDAESAPRPVTIAPRDAASRAADRLAARARRRRLSYRRHRLVRRVCGCGCGGALPPARELGQGRQFVYIRHHNRAWWQRRRAAENRAVLRREQAGRAA
jgi:hypothetical protein